MSAGALPNPKSNYSSKLCIAVILYALFLFIISNDRPLNYLAFDSDEYVQMANGIHSGTVFETGSRTEDRVGEITRTPIYPLIILFGKFLHPSDIHSAIITAHLLLAGMVFIIFCLCLRNQLSPWIILTFFCISSYRFLDLFCSNSSEWSSFCFLMLLFSLLVSSIQSTSSRWAFMTSFVCAINILTRPALLSLVLIPVLTLLCIQKKPTLIKSVLIILLCPGILSFWMGFNAYRFGEFSLSAVDGLALFRVGSVIGEVTTTSQDNEALSAFADKFKAVRIKPDTEILKTISEINPETLHLVTAKNLNQAITISRELGFDWLTINSVMREYSLRALSENQSAYRNWLFLGIKTLYPSCLFLIPCLLLPLMCLKNPQYRSLSVATMITCCIHVLHVLTVMSSQTMLPRYYCLTYELLIISGLCTSFVWIKHSFVSHTKYTIANNF